jgi:hypothetical protein
MEVCRYVYAVFDRADCNYFLPGGKSAVLSALTVALGGKATVTGRGSGLKSFIREGQRYAGLFCSWLLCASN